MKKAVIVSIQLVLFVTALWAAEKPAHPESPAEESCTAIKSGAPAEGVPAESGPALLEAAPTAPQGPPPCPQLQNCFAMNCDNNAPCRPSRMLQEVDTGITTCTQPGGSTFTCPSGKTIHVTEQPCVHCNCCFNQTPACFCPLDCGKAILSVGCK